MASGLWAAYFKTIFAEPSLPTLLIMAAFWLPFSLSQSPLVAFAQALTSLPIFSCSGLRPDSFPCWQPNAVSKEKRRTMPAIDFAFIVRVRSLASVWLGRYRRC